MRDPLGTYREGVAAGSSKPATPDRESAVPGDDALLAFATEGDRPTSRSPRRTPNAIGPQFVSNIDRAGHDKASGLAAYGAGMSRLRALSIAACVLVLVAAVLLWNRYARADPAAVAAEIGTAAITSHPEGMPVTIDDKVRGKTPLKLSLPIGNHTLKIPTDSGVRSIPLVIEAGTTVSQYFDLGAAATPSGTGRLEVTSDPAGATVRVDGHVAGNTPLALPAVTVGEHRIVIGAGDTVVKRSVMILPGATASIAAAAGQPSRAGGAAAGQPSTAGGWVSFNAPFEMQLFEEGRLIGTTSMNRIMLPTGSHRLDVVSTALDFRTTASVQVVAGGTANAAIAVPNGSLSVNALPWAEVEIDGRPAGATPLANIALPIGSHEIVWKHPERGERRRTVLVRASSPARIGVDFSE